MKYGKYLEGNRYAAWERYYIDYNKLKDAIKECQTQFKDLTFSPRVTSLSVARPVGKLTAEDAFHRMLDEELDKISKFTESKIKDIRGRIEALISEAEQITASAARDEAGSAAAQLTAAARDRLTERAQSVGEDYLNLEKYVNLNYMGFHKILKKHDKLCPGSPIRQFYVSRLHQQPWAQGNYSDVLVSMSTVYSIIRGDKSGQKNEDEAQGFVRSTTKYWVKTADVSVVKHFVLQHLPVFQFEKSQFAGDAQLINSVYMDNASMELYHGRLDKRPGAIALRMRWYGSGEPSLVFMERKTHRESWKGEESVKERFTLPEDKVLPYLEGRYTIENYEADLKARGKADKDIAKGRVLFNEIRQQIDSKQLRPMIRTQYMRSAFQIPFDATVRISLDTNLCMIKENPDDGPTCMEAGRWYRDPELPVQRNEITRFPHAVLEVKLSLPEGESPPSWVQELLNSGYLTEVHKFSKFIHGSCTLVPDMVQAVPYWVDDESIRDSMIASAPVQPAAPTAVDRPRAGAPTPGGASGAAGSGGAARDGAEAGPSAYRAVNGRGELTHPLLGDRPTIAIIGHEAREAAVHPAGPWIPRWMRGVLAAVGFPQPGSDDLGSAARNKPRKVPMRVEPKTYFANERTFLNWIHMSVTVGTIASAMLGFSTSGEGGSAGGFNWTVTVMSLLLLPVAILIAGYALYTFYWRLTMIRRREVQYFDDKFGPLILAGIIIVAMTSIFLISLADLVHMMASN